MIPLACPVDMVPATKAACIERLPYPGAGRPMLGLSALPEKHLRVRGTWDLDSLCRARGKRACMAHEWRQACHGTFRSSCVPLLPYRAPVWSRVQRRDPFELLRLDQYPNPAEFPSCHGWTGAAMMGTSQEWVRVGRTGWALTAGYWSRSAECGDLVRSHAPRWHDYQTSGRCCLDRQDAVDVVQL